MTDLYAPMTANRPRLKTDTHFADYANLYGYTGVIGDAIRYVEEFQLMDEVHWARFVEQFRTHTDTDRGWRGEYWGKMMRGACLVYGATRNADLYAVLTATVRDLMTCAEESGRISSYPADREFDAWDIWCRKYVLLGMQYFLEICEDKTLYNDIVVCMCRQLDYIMDKVGENGRCIAECTRNWRGLNSCSLLEPVVRLYSLTGEKKYLDYAGYIVSFGGTDVANLFDLACADKLLPYQYPVTKAYEMMSCFEGLLEYARITGEQKYMDAIVRFADRILESDYTVIGSCGCTHELFDHSTVRQTNTDNEKIMQETCVTVTLMKFLYQVHLLTGDPKYADAFEQSLYNAYLGAINTEKVVEPLIRREHPDWQVEPLPFDSYSPLTAGTRGNGIGGLMHMPGDYYYGCCACIGSAGLGLVPKMQLLRTDAGFALNLYAAGMVDASTPAGQVIRFTLDTDYPKGAAVAVSLSFAKEERFSLKLRIPGWSKNTALSVNGDTVPAVPGYVTLDRVWQPGDRIDLTLDMTVEALYPIPYGEQVLMTEVNWERNYMLPRYDREDPLAKHHIAFRRGPVMLAQDNRLGYSVDDPIIPLVQADGTVEVTLSDGKAPYPHILEAELPLAKGGSITVTDYASAGKLWTEESKMAVWMLTE